MLLRERNPEQEGDAMGGKKDIPRTVRLDEDLDAWAQSSAAECECSFSDLVRTALLLAVRLSKKKSGTPMSAAAPKHISCRLVSPNSTLDFTFVKSFGMVTYANLSSLLNALRTGS